jgi:hypothetical protein
MGRVLPAVDNIATFLQSYVATGKHIQDLPTLAHLRSELSRSATAQQMRSLALAVASLSSRLDNTATKDQANGPATLGQDIIAEQSNGAAASSPLHSVKEMTGLKKIVESSNLMLETLMQRVPPHPIQSPGTGSLDDSKQPQGSSQTSLPPLVSVESVDLVWQSLIATLRHALDAILLFFLWFGPAFQLCLRTLKAMPRSPTMLLDNNILFADALNRKFSLQYEQFRYWPVVSTFLECNFRDCPGALRIAHKRFAVFKEMRSTGRGVMIPFDEWEQMVRPGQRILMSTRIGQEDSTGGYWPARNACPSCGVQESRSFDSPVWKKW